MKEMRNRFFGLWGEAVAAHADTPHGITHATIAPILPDETGGLAHPVGFAGTGTGRMPQSIGVVP